MTAHLHARPTPSADRYPAGPLWAWPRPDGLPDWLRAAGKPEAVEVTYSVPERVETPSGVGSVRWTEHTRWFAATPETRDRAWWRSRLPGVPYRVHLLPRGTMHPGTWVDLGSVGPHEDPAPLLVVTPDALPVVVSGVGTIEAQRSPDGSYSLPVPLPVVAVWRRIAEAARSVARGVSEPGEAQRALMERVRSRVGR